MAVAAWLALAGCDSGPEPLPDGGVWDMELGTGVQAFEPFEDGERLPLVYGGQGGSHVWVSFRMRDLAPMRVLVQVTTTFEAPEGQSYERNEHYERRDRVTFSPVAEGTHTADAGADAGTGTRYEYTGFPAQLPDAVVDQPTRIDVSLVDRNGRRAYATRSIVLGEEGE